MEKQPNYSIKHVVKMISACSSIEEIDAAKNLLMKDLYRYSVADQGFLLTMVGIQIMRLDDGDRSFNQFFREFILGSIVISTDN